MTWLQGLVFVAVHQGLRGLYLGVSFAPNHKGMPVAVARPTRPTRSCARCSPPATSAAGRSSTGRWAGSTTRSSTTSSRACRGRTFRGRSVIVRSFCDRDGVPYVEASAPLLLRRRGAPPARRRVPRCACGTERDRRRAARAQRATRDRASRRGRRSRRRRAVAQGGRERRVLVDRRDPQHPGRPGRPSRRASRRAGPVQDRQRPVAPAALGRPACTSRAGSRTRRARSSACGRRPAGPAATAARCARGTARRAGRAGRVDPPRARAAPSTTATSPSGADVVRLAGRLDGLGAGHPERGQPSPSPLGQGLVRRARPPGVRDRSALARSHCRSRPSRLATATSPRASMKSSIRWVFLLLVQPVERHGTTHESGSCRADSGASDSSWSRMSSRQSSLADTHSATSICQSRSGSGPGHCGHLGAVRAPGPRPAAGSRAARPPPLLEQVVEVAHRVGAAQPAPADQVGARRDRRGEVDLHRGQLPHHLEQVRRPGRVEQLRADRDPSRLGTGQPDLAHLGTLTSAVEAAPPSDSARGQVSPAGLDGQPAVEHLGEVVHLLHVGRVAVGLEHRGAHARR